MELRWSSEKNERLKAERGVCFDDVAEELRAERVVDILEHSSRKDQSLFLVRIRGYVYCVPFVREQGGSFFLKTVYPSRKFTARYGRVE